MPKHTPPEAHPHLCISPYPSHVNCQNLPTFFKTEPNSVLEVFIKLSTQLLPSIFILMRSYLSGGR